MNQEPYLYLFLTAISIYISKKFGTVRNIGLLWSVIFSIFCPLVSFLIIFLSKKKSLEKDAPDITKWGVITLIMLILAFIGGYPNRFYTTLGSISLPYFIFTGRVSAEIMGEMSAQNIFTIFPIYALSRKYTSKYWS